jgi:HEAT repeat protein
VLCAAQALLKITPETALRRNPDAPIDAKSLAALARVLRSARPTIRAAVAASLARFRPTPTMIPVLGEAVTDPHAAVRAAALRALHDIGDAMPFVPPKAVGDALEDESAQVRFWAAGALGHAGLGIDPYVPGLLRHAEHDPDREVRGLCVAELREFIKPPAVTPALVPILTGALERPDGPVRGAACVMLARFGHLAQAAIPRLRELRYSASLVVSQSAHEALALIDVSD